MNYRKIYMRIVSHANQEMNLGLRPKKYQEKKSFPDQYFEFHHILPKSIFPNWSRKESNIVALTAREHFFCHQLLTKIYPCSSIVYAAYAMACDKRWKCSSRTYQKLKETYNKHNEGGKKQRGIKNPNKSHPLTPEQRKNISASHKGNTNTKGRFWCTNGIVDKMLYEVPEGWTRGRCKTRGKEAWNKGKKADPEVIKRCKATKRLRSSLLTAEERKERYGKGRRGKPAWNKGLKMNEEYRKKCRQREQRKKENDN